MLTEAVRGARYFRLGMAMWRDKQVFPYWLIPNLVNAILFALMGYFAIDYGGAWIANLSEFGEINLPAWLSWLQGVVDFFEGVLALILWLVVGLTFLMVLATLFTLITQLLMAPFLALLAEKVEARFRQLDYPSFTVRTVVARSFKREIQKMVYILLRLLGLSLLAYVLAMIPLINVLVPVIWFVYNGWMKAIEFADFAADNNGVEFKEMLARLKRDRWQSLGFGCATYFATIIPILNLVALPIATAGATRLWVDQLDHRAE